MPSLYLALVLINPHKNPYERDISSPFLKHSFVEVQFISENSPICVSVQLNDCKKFRVVQPSSQSPTFVSPQ